MGYGTARCVDRLKILSCFAWNACTDYSYYVSIIPCASWLQNYRLTSMWRWAMVRSFHVSIHPRLCGFSPSLHVTLMCVHVSQVLDQMVQESSTGWLSKIIHKWRVVVFRLVEYGQRKLSVTKLPSHRLEEKQNQSLRSNPLSMFCPNERDFWSTCWVKPAHFMSYRFPCSFRQATQYSEILVVGCKVQTLQGKKGIEMGEISIFFLSTVRYIAATWSYYALSSGMIFIRAEVN